MPGVHKMVCKILNVYLTFLWTLGIIGLTLLHHVAMPHKTVRKAVDHLFSHYRVMWKNLNLMQIRRDKGKYLNYATRNEWSA